MPTEKPYNVNKAFVDYPRDYVNKSNNRVITYNTTL